MKALAKRREGFTVVKWHSVKALSHGKVVKRERLYCGKVIALHSGKVAQWCSGSAIERYYDEVRQGHVDDVRCVWAYAHA